MAKGTSALVRVETIDDLTQDLVDIKNGIKDGSIELEVAKEFNNTAGKILNTVKVQLARQALILAFEQRGRKMSPMPYLEGPA